MPPMSVIHRGDLQQVLLRAAKGSGCRIITSCNVIAVDSMYSAHVKAQNTKSGEISWFSSDLVTAADGTKSVVRRQMALSNGFKGQPIPTGDAAHRLLILREKVEHDSVSLQMLDQDVAIYYMGSGGHVMAYPLRHNTAYNMVLVHPAKPSQTGGAGDSWTSKGDREEMINSYSSWSPAIRKWVENAEDKILEWMLYVHPQMPR